MRKGFTLIELLVVISILAILATLGFSTFTASQRKGRDAKRKSDIRDIQTALEQYYSTCGFSYPLPDDPFYTSITCMDPGVEIDIMPIVPTDPKSGWTPYQCSDPSLCTEDGYEICATLEAEEPNFFCVRSKQ